jgi:hypothetical protein
VAVAQVSNVRVAVSVQRQPLGQLLLPVKAKLEKSKRTDQIIPIGIARIATGGTGTCRTEVI